jgi:hypothetical protein
MKAYKFTTIWTLDFPMQEVWKIIKAGEEYDQWWRAITKAEIIEKGKPGGVDKVIRSHWKTALPYSFSFDFKTTKVIDYQLLEGEAMGELEGLGRWIFRETEGKTIVQYEWQVQTNKAWMNTFAFLLKPFFQWNHKVVMQWGYEDLTAELQKRAKF